MVAVRGYVPTQFDGYGDPWGIGRDLLKDKETAIDVYQRALHNQQNLKGKELDNKKDELNLDELERTYGTQKKIRDQVAQKAKEQSAEGKPLSDDDIFQSAQSILLGEGEVSDYLKLSEQRQNKDAKELQKKASALNFAQDLAPNAPDEAYKFLNENYPGMIADPQDLLPHSVTLDQDGNQVTSYPGGRKVTTRIAKPKKNKEITKLYRNPSGELEYISGATEEHNRKLRLGYTPYKSEDAIDSIIKETSKRKEQTKAPQTIPNILIRKRITPQD